MPESGRYVSVDGGVSADRRPAALQADAGRGRLPAVGQQHSEANVLGAVGVGLQDLPHGHAETIHQRNENDNYAKYEIGMLVRESYQERPSPRP
jgi:hypothetical protein